MRRSFYLLLLVCFFMVSGRNAVAQLPPGATSVVHVVTLDVTSVTPSPAIAGQAVTVNYSVQFIGISATPVTGYVAGDFQGVALQQPGGGAAPTISLTPSSPVTGSLVIPAPNAGQGVVTIALYPPPSPGCKGPVKEISHCRTIPIATTTAALNVIEPTVHVRIAGATYSKISLKDSHDQATDQNGFLFVLHDPGCGWWGNSGSDTFFNQKALPPGATLEQVDFVQYWPIGIDSSSGSGAWTWLDSSGSYFAHINRDDPSHPYVKWNNTCASGFAGKNLWYSISFVISMPKGTSLGETTYDPGTPSSYVPAGYSPNTQVVASTSNAASGWGGQVLLCNPTTTATNEYLHIRATLVTPYSGAQGSPGPMVEDNIQLQFSPGGVSGSASAFKTAQTYKQGTWKITDVYYTPAPTSPPNATVKNAVHLPGLPANPISTVLPGNVGFPVFDFRGGSCQ